MGWLSWTQEDYPQSTLVRLVQDGLLHLAPAREKGLSFSRLGAILRAVPIGSGRGRYLPAIDARIWGLEKQLERADGEGDENGPSSHRKALLTERLEGLRALRYMVAAVLELHPGGSGRQPLLHAAQFLAEHARCVNQMDEYSRERLLEEIEELINCIDEMDPVGLDLREWLADLPRSTQVGGQGPRPGCLFVSPLRSGGHSGRGHTFIVGLDDGRFPGPGLQDPLILDAEREELSEDLPTAAGRLSGSLMEFSRTMSRLRGEITLSYCCRDLIDDRDMFPSPVALSAFRILSGDHQGDQKDMLEWLGPPASFSPRKPEDCIDITEWLLWRLCGDKAVEDPLGFVTTSFPHLARGRHSRLERESARFTIYDGFVPEAGKDHDPFNPSGPVLSASRLEKLGTCPMEYFFHYVLEIEPPEEFEIDPTAWLDPAEKGGLLHAVFREFMYRLQGDDRLPEYERDRDLLMEVLDKEIAAWKAEKPPPNREVYEREVNDLRRTARIFLQEEERYCRGSHPKYFEAAIGLPPEGEGNPIDSPEPVEIGLPDGKVIRARGRIDRVDVVPGSGEKRFTVCDYKTGSSRRFDRGDPFQQGRRVQHALYLALARSRLAQCHPGAEVIVFGYFFPNTSEHGERMQWDAERLAEGDGILCRLCEMLASGCFPFTDDAADAIYSDYLAAFGDIDAAAQAVSKKLGNPENQVLRPFGELRGYEDDS
jgi:ATP-dependent helicase/nuclease subunit B